MTTLLDTNVLSELLRQAPEPAVLAWFARQPGQTLFVSAVTQAEMLLGVKNMPAGKRQAALQLALRQMFDEDFAGRVLPFDRGAVPAYVDIANAQRLAGRPISQFDAQIAAIAKQARARLATRNIRDFQHCSLTLVNPWDAQG